MVDQEVLPASVLQAPRKVVLSEAIYDTLRTAILDGSLAPGTRVVESTFAKQLGASRAPLREAIWLLKRDGLLVEESGRDTRVVELTGANARELHMIRVVLETLAYQSASRRPNADFAPTRDFLRQMKTAADDGDRGRVAKLDYEFHRSLCELADLPRVLQIWDEQQVLFRLWLGAVAGSQEDDVVAIADSHDRIIEAVESGGDDSIAAEVFHHVFHVSVVMADKRARWADLMPGAHGKAGKSSTRAKPRRAQGG